MRSKILKFPATLGKSGVYLLITTATATATGLGLAFQFIPKNDNNNSRHSSLTSSHSIPALFHAFLRSSRAISTIACTVVDYKYSLHGLPEDSDDYLRKLSEVHLRSAKRILKLCEANKGFYVKAGQFVAAMRQVPKEYSSTLSSLQDQAVPCHFKAIKKVLISNLGQDLSEM
uniref:Uncharacterized protein n=1 Tax=Fagus sylvatica TaxID=28930 RepID=A0A2N9EQH9_FAGSY